MSGNDLKTTLIFAMLSLLASEAFDAEMSAEEKKKTGIDKLSGKEKAALQQWIDTHYQAKYPEASPSPPPVKGIIPTLSENLLNGQYLRLSDGTLWNVRPADVPIAQLWITPVEIGISKSGSPFYPYKLINKVSGSSILARKAENLPQSSSPPLAPKAEGKTY